MIAGAGTMTSLVSLRAEFATINIIIAIILNMVVVYAVLKNTERIERIMGAGGLSILRNWSRQYIQRGRDGTIHIVEPITFICYRTFLPLFLHGGLGFLRSVLRSGL